MQYYKIHPEVPGSLGSKTKYDKTFTPWELIELHVVFDGWLGGDLLKISNCYLVTEALKKDLENSGITGIESFKSFELEFSDTFKNLYPNRRLPSIYRLIPNGKKGIDDIFILDYFKLIVSENVIKILNNHDISNSEIERYSL